MLETEKQQMVKWVVFSSAAAMSLGQRSSDSAPLFSSDSEAEAPEEAAGRHAGVEEPASGVSDVRARLIVFVLCFINLLNYMDRFTVAGVLPDIENYFQIDDGKSGLLQTGETAFLVQNQMDPGRVLVQIPEFSPGLWTGYMVLAPVFGYLGDRYNRKYIMCGGIAFWSVVTLASSFTPQQHFWALLLTRGLVGVGEASYSTIAPTIIADLYVQEKRTSMLSVFYFAIPVGSGLGYIVGSQVSALAQDWHWALRVTPALGLIAVLLLLFVVREPKRGAVEARPELHQTSWLTDLRVTSGGGAARTLPPASPLTVCSLRSRSFILSTLGFTAVAFVTGSLALWAPTFLFRAAVFSGQKAPCADEAHCASSESLIFGIITVITGVLGVFSGVQVSRRLRKKTPRADPYVCAAGLLLSAPFLYLAIMFAQGSTAATYVFIFLGETFLSMNWAIVADILLVRSGPDCEVLQNLSVTRFRPYVVVPTRRSTAEALQIVVSHLLGDAGSPYMIGVVSPVGPDRTGPPKAVSPVPQLSDSLRRSDSFLWRFRSLQLSLLLCAFVAVVGGAFFLATALFVESDRTRAESHVPADEPIVVPKSGRSARVPVSSVLI
ncbi:hypothetical protein CCH79_00020469 [Gambusia affinis]|uniref:Protein spinster homolog 1 n=1 Tax=Gambusia affinis TaxID=33528 RepID=A0A315W4I4_GAMAF|nr:hypothetical protein CCH79_00020469 [Gambusia affinis]